MGEKKQYVLFKGKAKDIENHMDFLLYELNLKGLTIEEAYKKLPEALNKYKSGV